MFRLFINLRHLLFWNVTRRSLVVGYRCFENNLSASPSTAKQSQTPPHIPEVRSPHLRRGGSLKSGHRRVTQQTGGGHNLWQDVNTAKFQSHGTNSYAVVLSYIVPVFLSLRMGCMVWHQILCTYHHQHDHHHREYCTRCWDWKRKDCVHNYEVQDYLKCCKFKYSWFGNHTTRSDCWLRYTTQHSEHRVGPCYFVLYS
jgi:hypothetical protein